MFNDVLSKEVFKYFEIISSIPRMSGEEKKASDYLCKFADERNLYCIRDSEENVFIRKPASAGYESSGAVLLQGHIDMVCQSDPSVKHNFRTDPLKLMRNGDILYANGTTLGADDGVSVAIMLALLNSGSTPHPELECLFTSREEIGLDGIKAFDASIIKAKKMINLDSADDGVATVSCAGGVRTDITFNCNVINAPKGLFFYKLKLSGLAGGHSGEDIHLSRANAIDCAALIMRFIAEDAQVFLISAVGGNKDNAIPRECEITFAVSDKSKIASNLNKAESLIRAHLTEDDKNLKISLNISDLCEQVIDNISSQKIIDMLSMLKSAPYEMCRGMPDIVETSYNLGILKIDKPIFSLTISSRSQLSEQLDDIEMRFNSLSRMCGAEIKHYNRYPGWQYSKNSYLQRLYTESYKKLFGKQPIITGIHAGLECGIINDRIPDMDIISLGPDIRNLHSPSETLSVSSLDRLYILICEMLSRM